MTLIKLGYKPKNKYNWEILSNDYSETIYNGKLVITIHELLWEKIKNIILVRKKGYDSLILIDGDRRTGKSTLGKTIAYLLNPNLTINNYVAGIEEAPDKIEKAIDDDVLVFDEGSLIANSKDAMKTKNVQLEKIIDVVGQKKLTLIFCMPSFFNISRAIAVTHSRFLLHTYTDGELNRGRFLYFSTKKKKFLYEYGKKHGCSYKKPHADWNGRFIDFKPPFEEEYIKLKNQSLREAINPNAKKGKILKESDYKTKFIKEFKERCPEVIDKVISKGFGISTREFYRRKSTVSIG